MAKSPSPPTQYVDAWVRQVLRSRYMQAEIRLVDYKGHVLLTVDAERKSKDRSAREQLGMRPTPAWLEVRDIDDLIAALKVARTRLLKSYAFVHRYIAVERALKKLERKYDKTSRRRKDRLQTKLDEMVRDWNKKAGGLAR